MNNLFSFLAEWLDQSWVMWPLLAMSLLVVTLIIERTWFWIRIHNIAQYQHRRQLSDLLRQGDRPKALALIKNRTSPYDRLAQRLLDEGTSDAVVTDTFESQRLHLERFMATLGSLITAAPMLGILGTVTGIISSFEILSDTSISDPTLIADGIGEALITTVGGLVIALIAIFPYNIFRAHIARAFGQMEAIVSAVEQLNSLEKENSNTD